MPTKLREKHDQSLIAIRTERIVVFETSASYIDTVSLSLSLARTETDGSVFLLEAHDTCQATTSTAAV